MVDSINGRGCFWLATSQLVEGLWEDALERVREKVVGQKCCRFAHEQWPRVVTQWVRVGSLRAELWALCCVQAKEGPSQ
jgi:hypothetical protein